MSDQYHARKQITFEQAEGIEPLPAQLRIGELTQELRALLWAVFHGHLQNSRQRPDYSKPLISDPWRGILLDKHIFRDHKMADDFDDNYDRCEKMVKAIFEAGDYVRVFGFVQWILRHPKRPFGLERQIDAVLRRAHAAYAVLDGNTIIPIGSEAERQTIERAFVDVASSEFNGARVHLRSAGSELTDGRYGPSIRESIHAVESVARVLDDGATTLDPALRKLEKAINIHPALRIGFGKLYGFTSDEEGIRHSLIDEPVAAVDATDALYMLGACAAFVSYLINKARTAGLLETTKK